MRTLRGQIAVALRRLIQLHLDLALEKRHVVTGYHRHNRKRVTSRCSCSAVRSSVVKSSLTRNVSRSPVIDAGFCVITVTPECLTARSAWPAMMAYTLCPKSKNTPSYRIGPMRRSLNLTISHNFSAFSRKVSRRRIR
jgi:hypothetical protein